MNLSWKERINRLDEFEPFFKNYLDDTIIKSIQYISLRKKNYGGHMILVGVTDINLKEEIETYAPRILKEIREYQENSSDRWEKQKLPKKLEVFEFNLEKAKERKEQKKLKEEQRQQWYANPKDFLEKTSLPDKYIRDEQKLIYNGLVIPIDHSEIVFKDIPAKCRILTGEYDFEVIFKSGKIYRFIEEGNKYYKFLNTYKENLEIKLSGKVGVCIVYEMGERLFEITKDTYLKHKKIKGADQ